jgi:hypothetical protein
MVEDARKLAPVAVIVVAGLPAGAVFGLIEVNDGTGLEGAWIMNVEPADVPPPGAGVMTVIMTDPGD